jgi:hypothetical protein
MVQCVEVTKSYYFLHSLFKLNEHDKIGDLRPETPHDS